jgi:3-oxoacyl-[acyl-carrier-protein] synthase II
LTRGATRRVAVTGLGLMTGLGLDMETTWKGLLGGPSPIRRFTLFDPTGLSSPFGVQLPDGAEALFGAGIKPRRRKQMTRSTQMAVLLARAALADSGLDGVAPDRGRIGVVVGATGTGYAPVSARTDPHRILLNMASSAAAWISLAEHLQGPSFVVSTACSSGAYALHSAMSLILGGQCDAAVSGAADSALSYLDVEGFCSLMALSDDVARMSTASRPFDRDRSGFVLGEGGGMLVLEELGYARRRGARIYAELSLPGLCSEAYNIMSPDPEGTNIARCMELALANAGIAPGDVDYINAHGTSTPLNDLCETRAIKRVFGGAAGSVPVSSTKSLTGHCLSAAAGVEAVICCLALDRGIIPPTMHLENPDPELDLDYVPGTPRRKDLRNVLSNSFAFGGQNGVCVFSKPD